MTKDSANNSPPKDTHSVGLTDLVKKEKIEQSLRNQSWDIASLNERKVQRDDGDDVVLSSNVQRYPRYVPNK